MRAAVQIIRIVRHWPCHSSASEVVWLNAGQTDSQRRLKLGGVGPGQAIEMEIARISLST